MKHFLHRCDRAMIYIFIASSYFPWLTVGTLSCWMLRELRWAIWLLAVLGITYQQIFHERYKMLELLLYLIMGLGPAVIIVTSNQDNSIFPVRYKLAIQTARQLDGSALRSLESRDSYLQRAIFVCHMSPFRYVIEQSLSKRSEF
ncbi:unnamed protein product [Euphydryas editha]|uniref:Uncharacterized protein n=1 Tax=Euphydryas editha TaxID=104508 RepID=A0AAU9U300_EUPED|nr:unnamed protein product [Euphydryas editha]